MISEALTRPLGPLPAWQWGLVGIGGYIGYRVLTGKSLSSGGGSANAAAKDGSVDFSQLGSNIVQGPQGPAGPAGPTGPAGAVVAVPKIYWASDVPAWIKATDPTGAKYKNLFDKYHLGYWTAINLADLKKLFKKE